MINEKQYLQDLKLHMDECLKSLKELDQEDPADHDTYVIIKKTADAEKDLREKYEVGARFNVIKSQLRALLEDVDKAVHLNQPPPPVEKKDSLGTNSKMVYVALFNAQGDKLYTWHKFLTPQALFDHSVNRPIYSTQEDIDAMLRSKANKQQQAYLEIAIDKNDLLDTSEASPSQNPTNFELLRIKQGSLKAENIRSFFHAGKKYSVSSDGKLSLKE